MQQAAACIIFKILCICIAWAAAGRRGRDAASHPHAPRLVSSPGTRPRDPTHRPTARPSSRLAVPLSQRRTQARSHLMAATSELAAEAITTDPVGLFNFKSPESKKMQAHYVRSSKWTPESTIVIANHGVHRDADVLCEGLRAAAERHGILLLCPKYKQSLYPKRPGYNCGNVYPEEDTSKGASHVEQWSFSVSGEWRVKFARPARDWGPWSWVPAAADSPPHPPSPIRAAVRPGTRPLRGHPANLRALRSLSRLPVHPPPLHLCQGPASRTRAPPRRSPATQDCIA